VNDTWVIDRIELYEDCTVNIFDRQGTKVYQITPYDNTSGWDGTVGGSQAVAGAYYYLISCGGDAGSATGSVTIVR
jgi:gliding motility-associated-like protein